MMSNSTSPTGRLSICGCMMGWLMAVVGCSHHEDTLQQALDKAQQVNQQQNSLLSSLAMAEDPQSDSEPQAEIDSAAGAQLPGEADSPTGDMAGKEYPIPFPERTDPFEFAEGVDFDAPQTGANKDLELKLFGFVGAQNPKAIVSVDGRTKTLGEGEKWGVLEVIAVSPPSVRIKSNGVVRVWSLLGQR